MDDFREELPGHVYLSAAAATFQEESQTFGGTLSDAMDLFDAFVVAHWPVLRHYRPHIVGKCLALAFDDPQRNLKSQDDGFGLYMLAGNHPADRDAWRGSYRDDGSYLSLQAHDYLLQKVTR